MRFPVKVKRIAMIVHREQYRVPQADVTTPCRIRKVPVY